MLRASFFALGMFIVFCGGSFMMIDKIILTTKDTPPRDPDYRGFFTRVNENKQHVFDPPQWAAFSMLSVGSVTMLYAAALPKKGHH